MVSVAGAVLAAGAGRRMGTPKAELVLAGIRLVDRAVAALSDAGCDPLIAVVRDGTFVPRACNVCNPDPGRGMRSSLHLAVDAAGECDALAVMLVDTPGVGADAIRAVLDRWRPGRIAVAGYGSRRGHPTVMAPVLWRAALALAAPDEGARALLRSRPDLVDEVPVAGATDDLDTPDDLARWDARASITVRAGTLADLPALRAVKRRASLANSEDAEAIRANPDSAEPDEGNLAAGRARVAVADRDRVVGFASWRSDDSSVELTDLFVEPDWMGRGIGRSLVTEAIALASGGGSVRIALIANSRAVGFYRRLGFSQGAEVVTEFGTGVRMHLDVAAASSARRGSLPLPSERSSSGAVRDHVEGNRAADGVERERP